MDGQSSDSTCRVVERLINEHPEVSIRLLDNPGKLSSQARNIGVRAARGRLIAVIDGHVHIANSRLFTAMERLSEAARRDVPGGARLVPELAGREGFLDRRREEMPAWTQPEIIHLQRLRGIHQSGEQRIRL